MTLDEIETRARKVVTDQWGSTTDDKMPELGRDTNFAEDLDFDSLDHVEMVMAFEEEFDLEVPDPDAELLLTFGQALDYLAGKLAVAA